MKNLTKMVVGLALAACLPAQGFAAAVTGTRKSLQQSRDASGYPLASLDCWSDLRVPVTAAAKPCAGRQAARASPTTIFVRFFISSLLAALKVAPSNPSSRDSREEGLRRHAQNTLMASMPVLSLMPERTKFRFGARQAALPNRQRRRPS